MSTILKFSLTVLFALAMIGGSPDFALSSDYYFPQVADGVSGNTSYTSSFLISNPQSQSNTVTFRFFLPNSPAWLVNLKCLERPELTGRFTTLTFTLSPSESLRLNTAGGGNLATGWAKVESGMPLNFSEIIDVAGASPGSAPHSEVSVLPAPVNTQFSFLATESVDEPVSGTNIDTGFALLNPGNGPALITVNLYSHFGVFLSQRLITLLPGYQIAQFVSQLFNDVDFAAQKQFHGIVRFSSNVNLSVLALRQTYGNSSILSSIAVNPDSDIGLNVTYDVEPNDSLATAQPIGTMPAMVFGTINSQSDGPDVDTFSVLLKSGTVLYVIVLTDMIGSPLNDTVQILGANGNPLISNLFPTGLKGPVMTFPVPADGIYYLQHTAQGSTFGRGSFYRMFLMAH